MQNRVVDYSNFDDVKKYAQELVSNSGKELQENQNILNEFLTQLHFSSLKPEQKFNCLSVEDKSNSTSTNVWTLHLVIASFNPAGLTVHFDILKDIIEKGFSKQKVLECLKTPLSTAGLNLILLFLLKMNDSIDSVSILSQYFDLLYQLTSGTNPVNELAVFELISYKANDRIFGGEIASRCHEETILQYINLMTHWVAKKIQLESIHILNVTKYSGNKNFLDNLVLNPNVSSKTIYQLIENKLLPHNQLELAKKLPGVINFIEQKQIENKNKTLTSIDTNDIKALIKIALELTEQVEGDGDYQFDMFLSALKSSKLGANEQLQVLSVRNKKTSFMANISENQKQSFVDYLNYANELIKRGVITENLYAFVESTQWLLLSRYFQDEKSLYLSWLFKLVTNKPGISAEKFFDLLSEQKFNYSESIGEYIAYNGDDQVIQKYIDLQIELARQLSPVKMQKLNSIKNNAGKTFIYFLKNNVSKRMGHFYQLIAYDLITQEQIDTLGVGGELVTYMLEKGDFNNLNTVKFLSSQFMIQTISLTTKELKSFLYKLQKSSLSAKDKTACLTLESSNDKRLGWSFGYFIAIEFPECLSDYFKILEDMPKDFSMANQIIDSLSATDFEDKDSIGNRLSKNMVNEVLIQRFVSLLKSLITQFPSLSEKIIKLLNDSNDVKEKKYYLISFFNP